MGPSSQRTPSEEKRKKGSGHLEPFRELSLNPSWPPPILRKSLTKIVDFWALPDIWKVGPLRFYRPLNQTIQEAMKGEVTYLT